MKLIIVEGPDRVGKNTLVSNITDRLDDYFSVHFIGPPDVPDPLEYQFTIPFKYKAQKTSSILEQELSETVVWNRSHLGEYVYGQIYRNENPEDIMKKIWEFEKGLFSTIGNENIYGINLYADPEYLIGIDDGESFTTDLEKKKIEINYFKEAFDKSLLRNKMEINIQVDNGNLKTPQTIYEEVTTRFNKI